MAYFAQMYILQMEYRKVITTILYPNILSSKKKKSIPNLIESTLHGVPFSVLDLNGLGWNSSISICSLDW